MAEPIFVAQPSGGQVAVSGLSAQNVADIARRMSQQAETRGTPTPPPSPTSALGQVTAMANATGGSTAAITGAPSRQTAADLQGRIQAASKPFVPELIAGYRDASGTYVPPSFTRPAAGQTIPSTLQTATGEFDPALIEQDPRYRLLAEQRKLLEERKATAGQDVEAAFVAREAALRGQQAAQAGEASMQLARMGALGTTVSGMSYLQNMDRRHLQESYDLGLQKAREIEKAKQLLENQQFDLVEAQLARAQQIETDFEARRDKQIERLQKFREIADKDLETIASSGLTAEQIDPEYFNTLDADRQLPKGTNLALFNKYRDSLQKQAEIDAIELEKQRTTNEFDKIKLQKDLVDLSFAEYKNLVDIQSKLPAGTQIEINGYTYTGWNQDGLQKGTQTDSSGNVTAYWYNPLTGESGTIPMGNIGATKDGWEMMQTTQGWMNYNKNTGELKPLNVSPFSTTLESVLPTGTVWGATTGRANAGQCGAVVNDLIGIGVGNSWESKQAKTDKTIGSTANPLRVWDAVIFGTGKYGNTGHIGLINSIQTVPVDPLNPSKGTKQVAFITESNVKGDRKMTHDRMVELTPEGLQSADWTGFARGTPIDLIKNIGTDGFINNVTANSVKQAFDIITPEERKLTTQTTAEEQKQLNKLVPDDILRDLNLPIGTKYIDIVGRNLKLPEKRTTSVSYDYKESIDPNTGKTVLFAINKADPKDVQQVMITPSPIGPTVPRAAIPTTGITAQAPTAARPFEIIGKEKPEEPLSASDIKSLREIYPGIDVRLDTTKKQAAELERQYIENRNKKTSEAVQRVFAQEWQPKISESLAKFAPRNPQVVKQVFDNTEIIAKNIQTTLPQLPDITYQLMWKENEKNRTEATAKITEMLQKGDYKSAANFAKRIAIDTSTEEEKKAENGRVVMINNLSNALQKIKEYQNAGGQMNIIEGSIEGLAGRLGAVRNKRLREIGSVFQQLLIDFRRNYTGSTFTPQESAQYEALLPNIKGNFDLNESKIRGLLESAQSYTESFYRSKFGDDAYNSMYRPVKVLQVKTRQEGTLPVYEFNPSEYIPLGQ